MPLTIRAIDNVCEQLKITNELLRELISIQQPKKEVVSNKPKQTRGNKDGHRKPRTTPNGKLSQNGDK